MNVRLNLSFLTDCSILFFFSFFKLKKKKLGGARSFCQKTERHLLALEPRVAEDKIGISEYFVYVKRGNMQHIGGSVIGV